MDKLKRTGRTTRMLEAAVEAAKQGRAVYVICASKNEVERIRSLLGKVEQATLGIKFETTSSIAMDFSWREMRIYGMHPNCKIFIDHYAIESYFHPILEELHRYDLKEK